MNSLQFSSCVVLMQGLDSASRFDFFHKKLKKNAQLSDFYNVSFFLPQIDENVMIRSAAAGKIITKRESRLMYHPDEIIDAISKLPTLPSTVNQVYNLSRDPLASVQDIIEAIKYDQGITANVLKMANSAYYSFSRKVDSISNAVILLGNRAIFEIILASCTKSFYINAVECYGLSRGELWRHCMTCAIASRIVGNISHYDNPQALFTAALLHDFGKTIIDQFFIGNRNVFFERIRSAGCFDPEVERDILGFDHAQIGALAANKWNFPLGLLQAIQNHHSKAIWNVGRHTLTRLVSLSNNISHLFADSGRFDLSASFEVETLLEQCGIAQERFDEIMEQVHEQVQKAEELLMA